MSVGDPSAGAFNSSGRSVLADGPPVFLRAGASRRARVLLLALASAGAVASAGLLYYSHAAIGATCAWCVASGAAMAALFVLALGVAAAGPRVKACRPGLAWTLTAAVSVGLGIQGGLMRKAADAAPIAPARLVGVGADDLTRGRKSLGPEDAPVTIVVFADLACPACRAAHASLVKFQRGNPAGVRLVFRHMPLWNQSMAAAAVGEIVAEAGRFWEFADEVYAKPRLLLGAGLLGLARSYGLDGPAVEARLADSGDEALARLNQDLALADRLGVVATPTFVVLVQGRPAVSANMRTLPRILDSQAVVAKLVEASRRARPAANPHPPTPAAGADSPAPPAAPPP